jgi:hypothetical protein
VKGTLTYELPEAAGPTALAIWCHSVGAPISTRVKDATSLVSVSVFVFGFV